jgi:D-sedoheptulose 7-phosphate isomerase
MSPIEIRAEYQAHLQALEATLEQCGPVIESIGARLIDCFQKGGNVLLCGNGGSAADAQHIAAEFINRFLYDHAALPAIALTTDTSILTAVGNDLAYELVFSRQVEALARPGDILVGISTSGKSPNVLKALEAARTRGITTIGFTGERGQATMGPKCDLCLAIPSPATPRIQECHLFAWHVICGMVEEAIFPRK